jgi:hypothetical protein
VKESRGHRSWLPLSFICVALALAAAPQASAAESTVTLRPAAGPAGTRVVLTGRSFGARKHVAVRLGQMTLARVMTSTRGAFDVSFAIPRGARGVPRIISTAGPRSAVNLFRISTNPKALQTNEIAAHSRTRLRWTPPQGQAGTVLELHGFRFPARRDLQIYFASALLQTVRTNDRGAFSTRIGVPAVAFSNGKISVRGASTSLAFNFTITSPPVIPPGGVPGPPPVSPGPVPTPQPPTLPAPQPTFPIRAAFYYPWFPEAWNQSGISPFTNYHPSLGFYRSDDQAVRRSHLRSLEYGKFAAGIYSWWGQGHYTDLRFPDMLAETNATHSPIKWAAYYEPEGYSDPTVEQIGSDLDYIKASYVQNPAYLKVGDKPVIFVYARGADDCAMVDRWTQANTTGRDFYLVLKVFPNYRTCPSQPQSWHQYAPSSRTDQQRGNSFAISPGFDLTGPEPERLPRDLVAFGQATRDMVASGEPWQLVISFNEWGENTATESADEWSSVSGQGQYLDVLAGL